MTSRRKPMKSQLVWRAAVLPVPCRKCAMAVILKTVALGASRRERQDRVQTIQRLNGCFFIDAEYRGMLRRTKIETNNVGRLGFKLRIIAGHIALQTVRLQASVFPYAMYGVLTHAKRCRQFAATPMRGTIARLLASGCQNPGPQSR